MTRALVYLALAGAAAFGIFQWKGKGKDEGASGSGAGAGWMAAFIAPMAAARPEQQFLVINEDPKRALVKITQGGQSLWFLYRRDGSTAGQFTSQAEADTAWRSGIGA